MKSPRKTVTPAMEKRLLVEARGQCPWCIEWDPAAVIEFHHIDGDPGNSVFANLIAACRNHHGKIERGDIPEAEVRMKKLALATPEEAVKLRVLPASIISAHTVNNSGVIAKTVHIHGAAKSGPVQVPGTIITSAPHYGYVEYLIKRLSKLRSWRPGGGGPPDNPGVVRSILEKEFGRLPKDVDLARFDALVARIQEKIASTTLGRMKKGQKLYDSFEEHQVKGPGKKR
jgi:hypothetical protein